MSPNHSTERTHLLNCLWEYQQDKGYISDKDVEECSKRLDMSSIELEGIISFYHFFHRQDTGQFIIYLNNSIVSEFKGYERVKAAFEKATGQRFGEIDTHSQFSLFETACIGLSDQEPAALINFHPFTNLNSLKVRHIIDSLKQGITISEICDEIPDNIRYTPPSDKTILFREYQPGITLSRLKMLSPRDVIEQIKKSNLRGLGGAFFPTGIKWEAAQKQEVSKKYIICNADEGEPGTFKDRVLMNRIPGLMLEGMIIAGYAVGAQEGIIYLRAEYKWLVDRIQNAVEQFRRMNLLGKNAVGIEGFNFDIRIQIGAGAYVCGEETALINSLEGKRGEPRAKMYFPTEVGFLGKPTIVNNVETFCTAARIIELGTDYYLNTGTPDSPGTKLLSISGDCHKPGIYEIEWGMTIAEILDLCEADDPHFIQVSGPSGESLSLDGINRKLSLDDLRCGGAFMVFNSSRSPLRIFDNFADFFKHESCGLCTSCRAGNFIIKRKLEKLATGLARTKDLEEIKEWGNIMTKTSRCGLGKMATHSLIGALDEFSDYFESLLDTRGGLNHSFDDKRAIQDYENFFKQ